MEFCFSFRINHINNKLDVLITELPRLRTLRTLSFMKELVPRPETLPSPRSDSEAHFMTKPLKWQKENDNSDDNKT